MSTKAVCRLTRLCTVVVLCCNLGATNYSPGRNSPFFFFHTVFSCDVFRPLCVVTSGSWHLNNEDKKYAAGFRLYSMKYSYLRFVYPSTSLQDRPTDSTHRRHVVCQSALLECRSDDGTSAVQCRPWRCIAPRALHVLLATMATCTCQNM